MITAHREIRACLRCGFKRLVIVHYLTTARKEDSEWFTRNCTACSFELKSLHYINLGRINEARARDARAKQRKRNTP